MKKISLPVAVGVAVICFVLAVYASVGSSKVSSTLGEERYKRITVEQQLQKALQEVKSLQEELGDAKSKMTSIEKILSDGRELAKELEAAKQAKDALQQQLAEIQAKAAAEVPGL